jgi:hypothetical protein
VARRQRALFGIDQLAPSETTWLSLSRLDDRTITGAAVFDSGRPPPVCGDTHPAYISRRSSNGRKRFIDHSS